MTGDEDASVRKKVLDIIRLLKARSEKNIVLPALDDESPEVRAAALDALAVTGTSEDAARAEKLLGDPDEKVRKAAQRAKERLGAGE